MSLFPIVQTENDYQIRIRHGIPDEAPEAVFLFNQPHFLRRQPCENPVLFEVLRKNQTLAFIYLFLTAERAVSPCRATFGSIECHPQVTSESLDLLLKHVATFVRNQPLSGIRIVSYPFCYAPDASQLLTAAFLRNNFVITSADENYHIRVTNDSFEADLHPSARRRLDKCRKAGFTFTEYSAADAGNAHQFISACRERRGFPMTLHWEAFEELFRQLPGIYRIFVVKDDEKVAALTVTVRINDQILYNLYPADSPDYASFSPTVLLTQGLYEYARRQGFTMLDLGISTDKSIPNYGLIRFKRNLGALPSLKLTFEHSFR